MSSKSRKIVFMKFALIVFFIAFFYSILSKEVSAQRSNIWWEFQAIDTMKYSRDVAGAKLEDKSFDEEIEKEVKNIADAGATHVAIATPYDEHFLPFLKRWVNVARKNNLKVWFRGNWSNWEGWFGYERKMSFEEHINKSVEFIKKHPELFENGDFFSACPECENGAAGDPRQTGKVFEYRQFLIKETTETKKAFESINKDVKTNLLSMNRDIADLVMDKDTTQKAGGVVTIDHYVRGSKQVVEDIDKLAKKSGGKIVLGEFGAPIPDIHGDFSEEEQAKWLDEFFAEAVKSPNLIGLSYWTNKGGSTELWKGDKPKKAVEIVKKYYSPNLISGRIKNQLGLKVNGVDIQFNSRTHKSGDGNFSVPNLANSEVKFIKPGYEEKVVSVKDLNNQNEVILNKISTSFWERLISRILNFFH